jgi:hypothetical protein
MKLEMNLCPEREIHRRLHLFAPKRFEDTLFLEYTVEGIVANKECLRLFYTFCRKYFQTWHD